MKYVGYVLLAVGLALFVFVLYSFVASRNHIATPIPEEEGVRVIYITPTQ